MFTDICLLESAKSRLFCRRVLHQPPAYDIVQEDTNRLRSFLQGLYPN